MVGDFWAALVVFVTGLSEDGWAAFAGLAAALVSALALLQGLRNARDEQRIRLTAVSAWAEPVASVEPIEQVGVRLTVRNDTTAALQLARVVIKPRFEPATPTKPGEPIYTMPTALLPLVPPMSTKTVPIEGVHFRAWRGQHPAAFLVAITFQDALGAWWWKMADGKLYRNVMPPRFPGDLPDLGENMRLGRAERARAALRRLRKRVSAVVKRVTRRES